MADLEQARAAKERLRTTLQGRSDVRGIGIARAADGYQLQVNVAREHGTEHSDLPGAVDGVDVRVRVVGAIHASA
jgi:hypothetical protein